MALGSPEVSIFVAGFPRKVSTIAIAIGGFGILLCFRIGASSLGSNQFLS